MDEHKKNKAIKKANCIFIIFTIICVASIAFCLLLPHGTYICITTIFVVCWVVALAAKLSKGKFNPSILLYPIVICALFSFMYVLPIFATAEFLFCERRPWEYEPEIKQLKQERSDLFYFPDELPECAENVQWMVAPSVWQAKGFLMLSFEAGDAYLQQYRTEQEETIVPASETTGPHMIIREELYPAFSEQYADYAENESFYQNVLDYSPQDFAHKIMQNMLPQKVSISLEEIETATQYHIDNMGKWGYIIVEETNRIIFYRDYEG